MIHTLKANNARIQIGMNIISHDFYPFIYTIQNSKYYAILNVKFQSSQRSFLVAEGMSTADHFLIVLNKKQFSDRVNSFVMHLYIKSVKLTL